MDANVFQLLTEDFLLASASHNISIAGGNIAFPCAISFLTIEPNNCNAQANSTGSTTLELAAINVSPPILQPLPLIRSEDFLVQEFLHGKSFLPKGTSGA